jgi:O-antigen ligase
MRLRDPDAWKQGLAAAPLVVLVAVLPFPHTVALRVACVVLGFAMAVAAWRRSGVPAVPCKIALALWAVVALLSLVWAFDPAYSLSEIKNEIGYTMMTFVAFFALTRSVSLLRAELTALILGASLLCAWAISNYVVSGRWDDALGHGGVGNFAAYAVSVAPALLVLATGSKRLRLAAGAAFVLLAVASVLSAQRILWPVLAVQILIAIWFAQRNRLLPFPARTVALVAVAVVVFAGTVVLEAQSMRYADTRATPSTARMVDADTRWRNWPKVADRIMEHPWIGAGFGRQVMAHAYPDLVPPENTLFWHAHNTVLNYGLSMGLPGIAVLLLVFACLARQYWRFVGHTDSTVRVLGAAGIMLLVGVLLRNQVNDFFVRDMALLFWAMNGAFLGVGLRLASAQAAR